MIPLFLLSKYEYVRAITRILLLLTRMQRTQSVKAPKVSQSTYRNETFAAVDDTRRDLSNVGSTFPDLHHHVLIHQTQNAIRLMWRLLMSLTRPSSPYINKVRAARPYKVCLCLLRLFGPAGPAISPKKKMGRNGGKLIACPNPK
jgi:hypothetical protein